MTLASGTRLGPYEVTGKLGEGGMGEVYRAIDSRLKRNVALKVLPAAFTADPERLARFEREAQLLAQLQHSNIASIFGLEEADGTRALVMELVEGEDLSALIARGPLPVEQALALARQIAEALEAAHARGIVHRDLKPANVKVAADGTVKVLDFGLAKALDTASGGAPAADLARSPTFMQSPTLTAAPGTQLGVILGTAAYMAPEQARGGAVDKRADIWAFGVVLYEMLTGRRLFDGETVSDVLAAVLTREPAWAALPAATPSAVRRLLRRCLERNPKQRLHDIADARLELTSAAEEPAGDGVAPPAARAGGPRLAWGVAVAALALAATLAVLLARDRLERDGSPPQVVRLQLMPAKGERLANAGQSLNNLRDFAISPDGSMIVYAVVKGATTELRLRRLDTVESTVLPGTEGGAGPFFSPDGRWVGFVGGRKLKKVALAGGTPLSLADAPVFRGAVWGEDGTIYFVPNLNVPVARVPDSGGAPEAVTEIRSAEGELQHRWPELLPGGEVLLYAVGRGGEWHEATIVAEDIASGERTVLVDGGTSPRFLPSGHLVYAREGSLYAVALDPRTLQVGGPAVEVARNVTIIPSGFAAMDVSRTGVLVTAPGDASGGLGLSWVDREGRGEPLNVPRMALGNLALSPQGDRVALNVGNAIFTLDLARLQLKRLTLSRRAESPVWSPDGRRIYFGYEQGKTYQVHVKPADDSGVPELVVPSDMHQDPFAISADGRQLLAFREPPDGVPALVVYDLADPQARERILLAAPAIDSVTAFFSPDDRWVVYQTQESGRPEIYVRPASGEDRKWQVSVDGGTIPVWSPVGDEIFFLRGSQLLSAPVSQQGGELSFGEPRVLFANHQVSAFAVSRDGKRFLVAEDPDPTAESGLDVAIHWAAEVQRRVAEAAPP